METNNNNKNQPGLIVRLFFVSYVSPDNKICYDVTMKLIGSTTNGRLIVEMSAGDWEQLQHNIQGKSANNPTLLEFPHINQNETGAKQYMNDCGMACVAMCIHALTDKRPSVDHLVTHYIEQQYKNHPLNFAQLLIPLKSYGLKPEYKRPFKIENIKAAVSADLPCIVLIKYSALPDALQAVKYSGSHFIVVSQYVNEAFRFHDPLAQNPQWINAIDLHTAMSGFKATENLPYQGMVVRG